MLRERQNTWRRLNLLGDLLLTYGVLIGMILLFKPPLSRHATGLLTILTLLGWAIFLYGPAGSYFYRMRSSGMLLKDLSWSLAKAFLCFTAIVHFLRLPLPTTMILAFFAGDAFLISFFRLVLAAGLNRYRLLGRSRRNVIIIGSGRKAKETADRISDNPAWGIRILGFLDYHRTGLWRYRDIPLAGHPDVLADLIARNQVDYVIIAVENADLPLTTGAFATSEEMGVTICVLTDPYDHPIAKAHPTMFMDFPAVIYASSSEERLQLAVKNWLDRIGALIGLALSIPVGLVAALAIKLEDGGPIFFHQVRSGKNGRRFAMYKFRTMVPNADQMKRDLRDHNEMSGPVFKIKNDPRITRVGSLLRKTSIDELPQFINILRGDMSLVGPRPPLPNEVRQYDRWQRRKLSVKPGLTCLWQVNGRNQVDFEDWMKLDLEYIDHWSLWMDAKILLKTVPAVLKGSGAS